VVLLDVGLRQRDGCARRLSGARSDVPMQIVEKRTAENRINPSRRHVNDGRSQTRGSDRYLMLVVLASVRQPNMATMARWRVALGWFKCLWLTPKMHGSRIE
jgi:hypothetical protein